MIDNNLLNLNVLDIDNDNKYMEMIDNVNRLLTHPESVSQQEMDVWLADKDFMSIYETMKLAHDAQIPEPSQEDVDEACRQFMLSHTPRIALHQKMYWAISAVAACLLLLCVMVFWHDHNANASHLAKSEKAWKVTKEGHVKVYERQEESDITYEMDGRKTKLGSSHVFVGDGSHSLITLTVPAGKTIPVVLSDGTKVWVNSDSKLVYPGKFDADGDRIVELIGEAYFDVAHDANRQFKVKNGDVTVVVHGTAFNVRGYEGEAPHVTLVRGSVSVSNEQGQCTIKPGEDVSENKHGQLVEQKVDTQVFTSWKNGVYSFDDEPLGNIMVVIGRCYNKNVVFANKNHVMDKLHFRIERSWSLPQILEQLSLVSGVDASLTDETITVK